MPLTTGKIVFRYVGPRGQHTLLYKEGKLIKSGFHCDTSIMLLLWCACDMHSKEFDVNMEYTYRESPFTSGLLNKIFIPRLFSKYDMMLNHNAPALVYKDLILPYKDNHFIVDFILSTRRDLILHMQNKFNIKHLEQVYELDRNEIFTDTNF